jgi:hypothetical protein
LGVLGFRFSSAAIPLVMTAHVALSGCGDSDSSDNPGDNGGTAGAPAGKGGSSSGAGGGTGEGGNGAEAGESGGTGGAAVGGKAGKGGGGGTAGKSGTGGAGGGKAGTGGTGDMPAPVDRGDTSMPDAELEGSGGQITDAEGTVLDDEGAGWLALLSSHYYTEPESDLSPVVERWLGLVENTGPVRLCQAVLFVTLLDAEGEEVADLGAAFVSSPNYKNPDASAPRQCLDPGERAIAAALLFPSEPLDTSAVTEVRYAASGYADGAAERYDWVTVEEEEFSDEAGGKVVSGTLVNGEDELSFWGVAIYGLGNDGVPIAAQDLSDGEMGIEPGAQWDFESSPFAVPVTDYTLIVEHSAPRPE